VSKSNSKVYTGTDVRLVRDFGGKLEAWRWVLLASVA